MTATGSRIDGDYPCHTQRLRENSITINIVWGIVQVKGMTSDDQLACAVGRGRRGRSECLNFWPVLDFAFPLL
jgi:hypothetical protein